VVALDQAGNQARGFGLLDEVVKEPGAGLVRLRSADRLLDGVAAIGHCPGRSIIGMIEAGLVATGIQGFGCARPSAWCSSRR
jgi:hypothetical protein